MGIKDLIASQLQQNMYLIISTTQYQFFMQLCFLWFFVVAQGNPFITYQALLMTLTTTPNYLYIYSQLASKFYLPITIFACQFSSTIFPNLAPPLFS
jgi:hypothetical protein